jgi:hypothetical protein
VSDLKLRSHRKLMQKYCPVVRKLLSLLLLAHKEKRVSKLRAEHGGTCL